MSAPAWFHNTVVDGLQRLYALSLPDRPAAEVLPLTAVTWVEVLWDGRPWHEELDLWRLQAAFRALAAECERWPAPKQLRSQLPARRQALVQLAQTFQAPSAEARRVMAELRDKAHGGRKAARLQAQPLSGILPRAQDGEGPGAQGERELEK